MTRPHTNHSDFEINLIDKHQESLSIVYQKLYVCYIYNLTKYNYILLQKIYVGYYIISVFKDLNVISNYSNF